MDKNNCIQSAIKLTKRFRIKYQKWTKEQAINQLNDFVDWVKCEEKNVFYSDYLLVNQHLAFGWLKHINQKYSSDKDINAHIKNIRSMIMEKKLELAQKGKIREASTIFEAKARHGYNDQAAHTGGLTINLINAGLTEKQLDSKIKTLLGKEYASDTTQQSALKDRQAIETTYQEIHTS